MINANINDRQVIMFHDDFNPICQSRYKKYLSRLKNKKERYRKWKKFKKLCPSYETT